MESNSPLLFHSDTCNGLVALPDVHTHDRTRFREAVVNIDPGEPMEPDGHYSVGLHPWESGAPGADAVISAVEAMATDRRVVMIGECGFDTTRGGDIETQEAQLLRQAAIAERVGKPLLLHVVGRFNEIIALKRSFGPSVPWIIHGFRGKPQLARQLIRHGFHLSLGERFNPATAAVIPADRLLTETDTSQLPIADIRRRIASARAE